MKSNLAKAAYVIILLSSICHVWAQQNPAHRLELNLNEAITLSIAKNYLVKTKSFSPALAKQAVIEEQGEFYPVLGLQLSNRDSDNLNAAGDTITSKEQEDSSRLFVKGEMPWGTKYLLEVNDDRDETVNGSIAKSSDAQVLLEVKQPLLKGFGLNDRYAEADLAKNKLKIQTWLFKDVVMDTVRDVIRAYADLYFAKQNLEVAIKNRDLASKLVEDNRKRVEVGRAAKSDIVNAEAGYARREEAIIIAERLQRIQENRFKLLISDDIDALIDYRIEIAALPKPQPFDSDVLADFRQAMLLRPDYQAALLNVNGRQIELKRDKRRVLPELDLVLRYGLTGEALGEDSAFGSLRDQRASTSYAGLNLSIPFPNRTNKAQLAAAELTLAREKIDIKKLKQAILIDIDNAAARVLANWRRIEATKKAQMFAERSLDAEEKLLRAGRSKSFFVLRLQEDLARAQIRQIQAVADYFKSLADYEYERGIILETYKVAVPD